MFATGFDHSTNYNFHGYRNTNQNVYRQFVGTKT